MTATFLPVRFAGGSGLTQPSSKPLSMIAHSMFLIVTGGSLMPSTHEPSQGAGQTRPVNSGKVVGLVQALERFPPQPAIDQIVPFGDQVVDRAAGGHAADQLAGVAERNAAIHAARALVAQLLFRMCCGTRSSRARALAARGRRAARAVYSMKPVGLPMYFSLQYDHRFGTPCETSTLSCEFD